MMTNVSRACTALLASWLLAAAPSYAESPESKPSKDLDPTIENKKEGRKFGKFGFGLTLGGGYDSNVFNKKDPVTQAALGELSTSLKLDVPLSPRLSWSSSGGFGGSYRSGDGDLGASGAKISARAGTGLRFLVFGNRTMPGGKSVGPKAQRFATGRLNVDVKYAMSANPVIKETGIPPPEPELQDPIASGEDLEGEFEDEAVEEEDDADADDSESESDEGDVEEQAEAEESEFIEEDVLTQKTFSIEGVRHDLSGRLGFVVEPRRGTSFGLFGRLSRGMLPLVEGKPSPNYLDYSGRLEARQQIIRKYLSLKAGYELGFRSFDERAASDDSPLFFTLHGATASVSSKPLSMLKLTLGYRFKLRSVAVDDALDSRRHAWSFATQVTLTKKLAVMGQLAFSDQALLVDDTKDAGRVQAIVGMRLKL